MILVDTKYEFGRDSKGDIILIDEIHTCDSSRYWKKDSYLDNFNNNKPQNMLDKENIREWLMNKGFKGEGVPTKLTD